MDEVGIRELIRLAPNVIAQRRRGTADNAGGANLSEDPKVVTVLDRVAQLLIIAIDHDAKLLFDEGVAALLKIYQMGLPEDTDTLRPPATDALFLATVIHRVLLAGAHAVQVKRFDLVPSLTLQRPVSRYEDTFWLRYAVTMAARGNIQDVFRGKSLIGPASDYVRTRKEFFGLFDENMDRVVDAMCQFDFLACVSTVLRTDDLYTCYPNFAGYYTYRTLPVVHDLVANGVSRRAIPGISNAQLAKVLYELDQVASREFFGISGWDPRYDRDPTVEAFIAAHGEGKI
jgi:hypothetical protein